MPPEQARTGGRASLRLSLDELDDVTIERAGELVAREQAVTRQICPQLPASFDSAEVCTVALQQLLDAGGRGVVATDRGRPLAVMTAGVRDGRALGRYARLPAEGLAVDPELDDPTTVLATVYARLVSPLVTGGVWRHYLLHVARPRLHDALANLGFARHGVYGVQAVTARRGSSKIAVRLAELAELDTVARLALIEIQHRARPPMFGPMNNPPPADLVAKHRALHAGGAVHLLATLDRRDVGLLTVELTSPVPRLCPPDQPYIGPTVTVPDARGRGVGQALVHAALDRAHQRGYEWISVDFETANPLSRPFWLGAGFRPTGYSLLRFIDPMHAATAR
jgi:GNAT superfamily N-acetyltransferase